MEEAAIPYQLPEPENHSFFFIDQRIDTRLEAKLHRHDAWELYCVLQGKGTRMAGDMLMPFAEGDVALIPPSMHHHWEYNPASAEVSAYVMAHYVHPISLDEIASEVGMNRSAFCSWFRRCKGMTFSRFVMQYRLETACGLLEHSQKSVSEICYLAGFGDIPHFVRVFTKEKGISPGIYRKVHQQMF